MTDILRTAIAGTGMIGRIHARSAKLAGAELVGVAASTPQRSRAAAEALGAERAFASAEELVGADDVDVVHICTPNHLHVELAAAALEAGKHVICEKPLAPSATEAARLTALAERARQVAAVPFVYRFYPTVREARHRIGQGDLGALRLLHGSYLQDWLVDEGDYNWRVDPRLGGRSRAFADIGSHWCDLVEFVSGHRIVRLSAHTVTAVPERLRADHAESFAADVQGGERVAVTTEDAAVVTFTTDAGATGNVVVSQVSPGRKNRLWFEVDGARGSIVFDQERPETIVRGDRAESRIITRQGDGMCEDASRLAPLPGGHPQGYHDCFDLFVRDAYEAILDGTPEGLPDFSDGLRAARITDAVLESARTGGWVEVPA